MGESKGGESRFSPFGVSTNSLRAQHKRDLFWRQVIGYVQRYLTACYAQAFAQELYYIVDGKEPLGRSFEFRVSDREFFFPLKDHFGLGFDSALAIHGCYALGNHCERSLVPPILQVFSNLISNKNIRLIKITQFTQPEQEQTTRCVIL